MPSPTSRSGKRIYLSVWDLFWAVVSPLLALYVRDPSLVLTPDWNVIGYFWLLASGFAILTFFALRLQDGMTRYFSVHQALDVAEAVLCAELLTFLALFTLTRFDGIPRSIPLYHGVLLLVGLLAARIVMRFAFGDDDETVHYGSRRERIIVIGANPLATGFIRLLEAFTPQRQAVIAVLDAKSEMVGKAISGVRILGAPHELESIVSEFVVHGIKTDRIVVAGEANVLSATVLQEIERVCRKRQIHLSFLPRMLGFTEETRVEDAAAGTVTPFTDYQAASWYFRLKRGMDLVGAGALIVLLSPVLILAGLLVFWDLGRPLLFWQERLGFKGRSFLIYKFRTLRAPFEGPDDALPSIRKPSAIGRVLRATRIDELPQLFNVLLGDMSLIGPRPLLPEDQPSNISVRLSVRPGITGWAQLNGGKLVTPEEKEKLDEWYVRNASLGLDLRIVWMTLQLLMRTRTSSKESLADNMQAQTKHLDMQRTV